MSQRCYHLAEHCNLAVLTSFGKGLGRSCHSSGAELPRPFKDIPGPRSLPLIGTLYKYLPYIGEYSFKKLHVTGARKLSRYGPLVREEIVPGVFTVWIFNPDDIAEILKPKVGPHPERRSHLALLKYRKDRKNIYNTGGLLPTNGPDWWRLRKEFQKDLSKPQMVVTYIENTDQLLKEFVELCQHQSHSGKDLLPLLSRLFLEVTCLVAFDTKLNSFSLDEMRKNSRSSRLIDAAYDTNSAILKLDNGPRLWRFFDTPLFKKLVNSQRFMESFATEMVSRKKFQGEKNSTGESLFEKYLNNTNLDEKDVVGMACDMLLAGIDTTAYSISFALYHLGRNLEAQENLYREAVKLLPNRDDSITSGILEKARYTKSVLKETFRLNPVSVGVGRVLTADTVLSGFSVPAGTVVVTQNQVSCRLPEYFTDPESYLPERWLRENNDTNNNKPVHPYLVLPFGHGSRSCIAKRLAEQSMQIFLLRLCRNLRFEWEGEKLDSKSLLINVPDGPIKLRFTSRH